MFNTKISNSDDNFSNYTETSPSVLHINNDVSPSVADCDGLARGGGVVIWVLVLHKVFLHVILQVILEVKYLI